MLSGLEECEHPYEDHNHHGRYAAGGPKDDFLVFFDFLSGLAQSFGVVKLAVVRKSVGFFLGRDVV